MSSLSLNSEWPAFNKQQALMKQQPLNWDSMTQIDKKEHVRYDKERKILVKRYKLEDLDLATNECKMQNAAFKLSRLYFKESSIDEDKEYHYVIQPFIENAILLSQIFSDDTTLSQKNYENIVNQLIEAINMLNTACIKHGDLSADDNILVQTTEEKVQVYIVDFDCAVQSTINTSSVNKIQNFPCSAFKLTKDMQIRLNRILAPTTSCTTPPNVKRKPQRHKRPRDDERNRDSHIQRINSDFMNVRFVPQFDRPK